MASHDEPDAERLRERVAELERQLQAMEQTLAAAEERLWRRSPPPVTPATLVALQDREQDAAAGRPTPLLRKTSLLRSIAETAPVTPPAPPGPFPPPPSLEPLEVEEARSTRELRVELAVLRARIRRVEFILSERARLGVEGPAEIERSDDPSAPAAFDIAIEQRRAAAVPQAGAVPQDGAPPTTWPPPASISSDPSARLDAATLERFVGGRLIAWLGACVLIAAFGLFGHLAYQRGWFAFLTPTARLAFAYVASLGLLVVAELLRRRLGRAASVGCAAAGIAGLYVTTAVGVALDVFASPEVGLLAATTAAAIGLAATLWFDALAIAAIALLGGYFAPIFAPGLPLAGPSDSPLVSGVHFTVCLLVGLVPSLLRHERFHRLRIGAIVLQSLFGAAWLFGLASAEPTIALLFVSVWWAMAIGEAMVAAMRGYSRRENQIVAVVATVPASSVVASIVGSIMPWASPLAYTPLLMAALSVVGSFSLPRVDVAQCETDEERSIAMASRGLAATLRLLAVLLLALGVSPFLGSTALAFAWAIAAVAVGEAERRGLIAGGRWGAALLLTGAWIAGCSAIVSGLGAATTLSLPTLLPRSLADLVAGLGTIAVHFAQLGLLSVVVAGIVTVRRTLDHVPIARGFLAAITALAWCSLAVTSARDWAAVVVLTLMPVAFAFGRRLPLPGLGMASTIVVALLWSLIKIDGELTADAPRMPTVGVDILLAATLVATGAITTARVRIAFARILSQITLAVMVAAFAAILIATYVRLVGIGDHPSDRIGLAAAIVAVLATAMIRFGLERRAMPLILTATVEVLLATGLWIGATLLGGALTWGANDGWPVVNIGTVAGVALIGAAWRARGFVRSTLPSDDSSPPDEGMRWLPLIATLMTGTAAASVIALLSREAARLVALVDPALASPVLSVLWGSCGIAFIAAGFVRRAAVLRWVGLGALGVVAIKVLAWDMRGTDTLLRVAMLIGIGLILVVASVLYARRAAQEALNSSSHGGDTAS